MYLQDTPNCTLQWVVSIELVRYIRVFRVPRGDSGQSLWVRLADKCCKPGIIPSFRALERAARERSGRGHQELPAYRFSRSTRLTDLVHRSKQIDRTLPTPNGNAMAAQISATKHVSATKHAADQDSLENVHTRNVLSVSVPIRVTVANKKVRLDEVLNLTPGTVLRFDQNLQQPLRLDCAGQGDAKHVGGNGDADILGQGHAVMVGDRIGIRLIDSKKQS